jgi:hypothetical protein
MKVKLFFTALLIAVAVLFNGYKTNVLPVQQASAAVHQLDDSATSYVTSRAVSQFDPSVVVYGLLLGAGIFTWRNSIKRFITGEKAPVVAVAALMLVMGSACVGKPQLEVVEEIAPNETAFMVPLEGNPQEQAKTVGEKYYDDKKVLTKRVSIPTRKQVTGRNDATDYDWIPTVKLIKVDRTPIVREWTKSPDKGTSTKDQAITVESLESIDFSIGVNASASITEEDAARFLYWFNGASLQSVMDQNVRTFVQSQLFEQFGTRSLEDGKAKKKEIFDTVQKNTREFFKPKGLTVDYVGGTDGMNYTDPKI